MSVAVDGNVLNFASLRSSEPSTRVKVLLQPSKLLLVSLALLILTILSAPTIDRSSDMFHYVKNLPVTYWIGLLVTMLVFLRGAKGSSLITVLSTAVLACYLFGIPSIVYANDPGSRDTYGHLSHSIYTSKTGGLGSVEAAPGSYLFAALLYMVTNIHPMYLLKAYHLVYALLMPLAAYLAARRAFGNINAYVSPLAVLALLWFGSHFGKNTYAYILWGFFWLFSLAFVLSDGKGQGHFVSLLLVYAALVISHPLTCLLIPAIVGAYMAFSAFRKESRAECVTVSILLILIIVWSSWYIVGQSTAGGILDSLQGTLDILLHEMTEPLRAHDILSAGRTVDYIKVIYLRVFLSLFEVLTGFVISIVILLKSRTSTNVLTVAGFFSCIGLFASPFSRMSFANFNRGPEHALMLYTLLLSWFVKFSRETRAKFARAMLVFGLSVLTLMIFLTPISSFCSSMPFMHIPTTSHEAADFLSEHYSLGIYSSLAVPDVAVGYHAVLHGNFLLRFKLYNPRWSLFELYSYYANGQLENISATLENDSLVVTSYRQVVLDRFYLRDPPFSEFAECLFGLIDANRVNKVHTSSQFCAIYYKE